MVKVSHRGLKQTNKTIDLEGNITERPLVYLDSTASALSDWLIEKRIKEFLKKAYANTHTEGHHRGRDSTEAVEKSRDAVGKLVGYNPEEDVAIFKGFGATGPLNYLAEVLFPRDLRLLMDERMTEEVREGLMQLLQIDKKNIAKEMVEKPVVVTTEMEHHANLITWYGNSVDVKIVPVDPFTAELDINQLKEILEENKGRVRLVTVSGASNVTGIRNPIYEIAKMAHEAGAEICVDSAQLAPHHEIQKRRSDPKENIDYLVMSPHKFAVPGTPGVLVANRSLIESRRGSTQVGGGIVNTVTAYPPEYTLVDDLAAGEEPGTPNIPGIVAVGLAAAALRENMPRLTEHEKGLTKTLMNKLQEGVLADEIKIIGSLDPDKRVGVVSIAVEGVPHEVVTAYLNDHWNIAVRNGCFCAHPLIIKTSGVGQEEIDRIKVGDRSNIPGYVRISLGEHSTNQDINTVVEALTELVQNKEKVCSLYEVNDHGTAVRKDGFKQERSWDFDKQVEKLIRKKENWLDRVEGKGAANEGLAA